MNVLFYILLGLFLAQRAFSYILSGMNLNYMKKNTELPEDFKGILDETALKKSRDYLYANTSFGIFSGIFTDILVGIFMFGGIIGWYSGWIDGLKLPFIVSGILFFLIMTYAETLLSIPFSIYHTFKIEKEFGFNKMTAGLWVADTIKSLLIQTVLFGVLISAGLAIVQASPNFWWLFLWIFYFAFTMFMLYVSPYVIEPLFNKFSPVEDEELNKKLSEALSKTGIQISKVMKMDASKRSTHTNAYFSGIGHVKRIVLFDTLLEKLTHEEIVGVLAHEAGHWKKKHLIKTLISMEVISLILFYVVFLAVKSGWLSEAFGIQNADFFARAAVTVFAGSLILFFTSPLSAFFSRKHENEADRFAVELTGTGEGLAGALKKLSRDNLSNLFPHPFYAAFHYSHPPVLQRLKNIEEAGKKK